MATEKQRDDLDVEDYTLELIIREFQQVYNAIEQLRIDLIDKIDTDANMRIRDDNYLDKRINDITKEFEKNVITKEFEKINKQLKSLRDADNNEIKKYLTKINIGEQLETYDEKRRNVMQKDYDNLKNYFTQIVGLIDERLTELDNYIKNNLLQKFNTKNRDIKSKIEEIKNQIDLLMKSQLLGSEDEDTEVQGSSDDKSDMEVEELQQRVDDILKF